MKEDREKLFKKMSSSEIDETKFLEIEKKIDEVISKNEKTITEKSLVEKYSFKNKEGDAIYFLKEKKPNQNEKSDLETNSDNRDEIKKEVLEVIYEREEEKNKSKRQIRFGKKKTTASDKDSGKTEEKNEKEPDFFDKKIDKIISSEDLNELKKDINETKNEKTSEEKHKKTKSKLSMHKLRLRAEKIPDNETSEQKNIDTTEEVKVEKEEDDLQELLEENISGEKHIEHVFFDELDASSNVWSPILTTEEKKVLSIPAPVKPELKTEEVEVPKELFKSRSITLEDLGLSKDEWEELEFYPLMEPFAFVEILREKESLDKCYFLIEVDLTEEEKNLTKFILETMSNLSIDYNDIDTVKGEDYILNKVNEIIKEYNLKINEESKIKIVYHIGKASFGLDKIDPLMRDPNIEDISCDGSNIPIFLYHRKYGSLKSNVEFKSEDELSSFIFKLAQKCGKHISIAEPMLDATMPDGSRIQMTLSDEITAKGSTFTIRKFRENPFSPPDLAEFNTMSSEMIAYMWLAVENGVNALIAGGTASGKTTVLNALSLFIPRESKIVSIEETREINLPHPNWIQGVARAGFGGAVSDKMVGEIDMYDLMKAALRQRPEYIIVGEIRGKEAYVLFQAMATGHATYSTVHADSAKSLIHRLEGKPIEIPRVMLQSLDIVSIHITTRVKGKRVRRCKQIIEIIDIDPTTKEILTNEAFHWDPVEDKFIYTGKSYVLEGIRARWDMDKDEIIEELKKRAEILEWMHEKGVRTFKDVARVIAKYAENSAEVMKMVRQKKDEKVTKDDSK